MSDKNTSGDKECPKCNGTGSVSEDVGGQQRSFACPQCHGKGRVPADDDNEKHRP